MARRRMSAGDVILTFGANSVVTLKGVSKAMLTEKDFLFV